jgi:hypothetical protein
MRKIILNTKNIVDKQFVDLMSAIISLAIVGISKGGTEIKPKYLLVPYK